MLMQELIDRWSDESVPRSFIEAIRGIRDAGRLVQHYPNYSGPRQRAIQHELNRRSWFRSDCGQWHLQPRTSGFTPATYEGEPVEELPVEEPQPLEIQIEPGEASRQPLQVRLNRIQEEFIANYREGDDDNDF